MLIDWFTVGAQVVNFLILVWLLKRFLYKPILHAIDERERRIAKELADADTKKPKPKRSATSSRKERRVRRAARGAPEQGEGRGKSRKSAPPRGIAAGGRRPACQARGRIETRTADLNDEITRRTLEEVFAIARKALTDLAGTSLEERMSEVFTRRLRELDDEAKEKSRQGPQDIVRPGARAQRLRAACGAASCDTTCAQRNLLG
jgi:F-type H+-transporting ATPase subunit b